MKYYLNNHGLDIKSDTLLKPLQVWSKKFNNKRKFLLIIFRKLFSARYKIYLSSLMSMSKNDMIVEANLIAVAQKIEP